MRKMRTGKYGQEKFGRAPGINSESLLVAYEMLWTIIKGKLKLSCLSDPTPRTWWGFSEKGLKEK